MKYIVRVNKYWLPVMCKSFVKPTNFAFPTVEDMSAFSLGAVEEGTYYCSYPRTITDTTTLEEEAVSNLISSTKPSH
jgi:hypothetical protein